MTLPPPQTVRAPRQRDLLQAAADLFARHGRETAVPLPATTAGHALVTTPVP